MKLYSPLYQSNVYSSLVIFCHTVIEVVVLHMVFALFLSIIAMCLLYVSAL